MDCDNDEETKLQNTNSQTEAALGATFEILFGKKHPDVMYFIWVRAANSVSMLQPSSFFRERGSSMMERAKRNSQKFAAGSLITKICRAVFYCFGIIYSMGPVQIQSIAIEPARPFWFENTVPVCALIWKENLEIRLVLIFREPRVTKAHDSAKKET
jgi:hypothetical protein